MSTILGALCNYHADMVCVIVLSGYGMNKPLKRFFKPAEYCTSGDSKAFVFRSVKISVSITSATWCQHANTE